VLVLNTWSLPPHSYLPCPSPFSWMLIILSDDLVQQYIII
jgi:hypothetical protein